MSNNFFFIGNGVKNVQIGNNSVMIINQDGTPSNYYNDEYTRQKAKTRREKEKMKVDAKKFSEDLWTGDRENQHYFTGRRAFINHFSIPRKNRRFQFYSSGANVNIGGKSNVTITEVDDDDDTERNDVTITEVDNEGKDEGNDVHVTDTDNEGDAKETNDDGETEREIAVTFISTAPGLREKSSVLIKPTMNILEIEASVGRYTGRGDMTVYTIRRQEGDHIHRSEMNEQLPIHAYDIQNGDVFYVM